MKSTDDTSDRQKNGLQLTSEVVAEFRKWIVEILDSVCMFEMDECLQRKSLEADNSLSQYDFYFKRCDLPVEAYNEFASLIVDRFIKNYSPSAICKMMADDPKVLLDDEAASRWLRPIASAERTTLAYERGMRLEGNYPMLSNAIMQKAANAGDDFCALHLVRNTILRNAQGEACHSGTQPSVRSVEYERGCVYLSWKMFEKAQAILQRSAANGDADSAMLLIRNKLLSEEKKMLECPKRDKTVF